MFPRVLALPGLNMKKRSFALFALVLAGAVIDAPVALTEDVTSPQLGSLGGIKPGDKPSTKTIRPSKDGSYTVSKKSPASRLASCNADCRPNNYKDCGTWGCKGMHGLYRSYNHDDPQLKSIKGKQDFQQCVSTCMAPLPKVYIQRAVFGMGLTWFGKKKEGCLDCHAAGH
jgi:hypothetical protein